MASEEVFRASASERLAFADLLAGLSPEQLAAPSLCGRWDVATVGAHLGSAITTRISVFAVTLIRHRGDFDRANDATARKAAKRGTAATIETIRSNADSRFTPPGTGPRAPLTDVLVHTGDVARPLGLPHAAPDDHVRIALEFLDRPRTIGFVKPGSLDGLRFVADDLGAETGEAGGEELHGRGIDLMMAICGRSHALDDLRGPGVALLRSRLVRV
ncbi:MAG TPA: maleylpyruvate isomerase family mycothiol-dependent enzyme [Mycobacteriales bacterium]|nr:maleylpyruvate isomerase family mycothiol-dependent enzyme [Mycobacteriales bacterium]